jgi:hypothetical protein
VGNVIIPGNHFCNYFLDCAVMKRMLPFLMFQAVFTEIIYVATNGTPVKVTLGHVSLDFVVGERTGKFRFFFFC